MNDFRNHQKQSETRPLAGLLFVVLLGFCPAAGAATYYVRTDGNNSNAGTGSDTASAWATINYAATATLSAGDVVYVKSGTYAETVAPTVDGTSGSPIQFFADTAGTVAGWSPGTVTILAGASAKCLDLDSDDYLTFTGFALDGDAGNDVVDIDYGAGVVIANCEIFGGAKGVEVGNGASVIIVNCLVRDNVDHGIEIQDGTCTVQHATIASNGNDGIKLELGSATVTNSIISNNTADGLDDNVSGMTHSYNLVYGSGDVNYEGTSAGTGEISSDPLFVSATDYHLRETSPAKDAGTNLAGTVDDDFHGNPRPYNTNWDMGYHEYGSTQGTKALLLISQNDGYLTTQERARKIVFEAWGYAVTPLGDAESQTNYDAALATSGVVYVSVEVNSTDVAYKLRETTLGIVIGEPALSDEFGFSSTTSDPGTHADITIDDNSHYITSTFATGALTIYDTAQDVRYMSGTVATGASVLGSYSANSALAVVDIGDSLDNSYNGSSIAFGRRVFLPVGSGFDFTSLTDDGLTLVQRALEWASGDLVGHWKLDETGGTTAADSSDFSNDGTYTNGPILSQTGVYGSAAAFDGNDDRVVVPDDPTLNVTAAVTMAAWVNPAQTGNSSMMIINKEGEYEMALTNTGELEWAYKNTDPGWSWHLTGAIVPDGQWSHVAVTYSDGTVKSYVNGQLVDTYNGSGSIGDQYPAYNELWIGARSNNPTGASFGGLIDDARVYSKELTAAEVIELYGFLGHWKLDETSGATATDSSGLGHQGTVSGGANWATNSAGDGVFDFDGSTNYISVADAKTLQITDSMTLAGWVKGDAWGAGAEVDVLIRKGESNPNNYQLAIADGSVQLCLDQNDDAGFRGNTVLKLGRWYHVAATWDGATVKIYVNGQLDNTPAAHAGAIGTDNRSLYLGGRSGTDLSDGMQRDLRLYDRALSPVDIAGLYGLIGHWKMDEGSGTTAADDTAFSNDATVNGATWTSDCAGNNGLEFDGFNDTATTNSFFDPPERGTVALWFRSAGPPAARQRLWGAGGDFEMWQDPDGLVSCDVSTDGLSGGFITDDPLHSEDRWYHLIAQYDSADDSYAIYINGELHKSGISTYAMAKEAANTLTFGTRTGSTDYFEGAIRDFRIYNRPLSDDEISVLSGLVAYWKLNETSGTVASDSSPNGYDGTLYGNPVWTTAGIIDGALDLETTDGVDSVDAGNFDVCGEQLSLAAWIKPENGVTAGRIVIKSTTNILSDQYWGMAVGGSLELDFRVKAGGTTDTFTAVNVLSPGKWHYVAGTYDGTTMLMYVNGVEISSQVHAVGGTLDVDDTVPVILGDSPVGGRAYDGMLDDVRVLSRVMCPEEIRGLYKGGRPAGVRILKWVEVR